MINERAFISQALTRHDLTESIDWELLLPSHV